MNENDTTGRCTSCGFLAYQSGPLTVQTQYQEVPLELDVRGTPEILYRPRMPGSRQIRESMGLSSLPADPVGRALSRLLPTEIRSTVGDERGRPDRGKEKPDRTPDVGSTRGQIRSRNRSSLPGVYPVIGLTPKDHLMERRVSALEDDRRAFQLALDRGSKRLMWAALILGGLLAAGQLLAAFFATPDAYGSRWIRGLWPPSPPPGMNDRV